jgi:hypothetical protein
MRTSTSTNTMTATRLRMLEIYVTVALCRFLDDADDTVRGIVEIGIRQKLIKSLTIGGLDGHGHCRAALTLEVNWDEHERQSSIESRLRLDGKSVREGAPELRTLLTAFEDQVDAQDLRVQVKVQIRPGFDKERVRRLLGLSPMRPCKWTGPRAQTSFPLRQLSEMSVTLELADDTTNLVHGFPEAARA